MQLYELYYAIYGFKKKSKKIIIIECREKTYERKENFIIF